MTSSIPEPWASALIAAKLTDPRYTDERPSLSRLADVTGLHTTTISRMVRGIRRADPENVALVAAALGRDVVEVSGWVKQARTVREPYRVPAEVNLLTDREQAAISELIRSMAASREDVTGNAQHPASIDDPTDSAATARRVTAISDPDAESEPGPAAPRQQRSPSTKRSRPGE